MVEIKTEHEGRCEAFVKARDFGRAAVEAAKAAECGFALAARTVGAVAEAHAADAEGWVELAAELKRRAGASGRAARTDAPARDAEPDAESGDGGDGDEWRVDEKPDVTFDDIAGMADAKRVIREMVVYPMQSPEKARALGLAAGGGVLVYGPPGTGKTMLGKAVAGELACPFYYASGAQLRSKWYGESEQRLSQLLRAAQARPMAVLFLDEVEALLPRRGDGTSGADGRMVTQFLADVGGFRGSENVLLILAATNKPWDIDEAVFRTGRFDEKLYVGPPDAEARLAILAHHLGSAVVQDGFDAKAFARGLDGYSGSDVAAIVHAAKRLALGRAVTEGGDPVVMVDDLMRACNRVPSSITPDMLAEYARFRKQRFG